MRKIGGLYCLVLIVYCLEFEILSLFPLDVLCCRPAFDSESDRRTVFA